MTPEQLFEAWWKMQGEFYDIASVRAYAMNMIDMRAAFLVGYAQGQAGMKEAAAKVAAAYPDKRLSGFTQGEKDMAIGIAQAIRTLPAEEAPHAEG